MKEAGQSRYGQEREGNCHSITKMGTVHNHKCRAIGECGMFTAVYTL
jgi:hypothetical protein